MPTVLGGAKDRRDYTAPTSLKVGETSFGKDISIARCKNGRMFQIDVAGGGTKPVVLSGLFTNWSDAENAVRFYIDSGHGRYAGVVEKDKPLADRPKLKMDTE